MKTAPSVLQHATKKPTKRYVARAKRLKTLVEKEGRSEEEQKERSGLEKELCAEFMKAFSLESDRVGARFFSRIPSHPLGLQDNLMDHARYFRRGENFVVVSQTYALPSLQAELERWATSSGARCTLAPGWGFYYPERAFLFLAEFTPEQKAAYAKRLDSHRN